MRYVFTPFADKGEIRRDSKERDENVHLHGWWRCGHKYVW